MQKYFTKILIGSSIAIILGTLIYVFWPSITHVFTEITELYFEEDAVISENEVKKKKGITRKISYRGRMREAKKLIEHEYYTIATLELLSAIKEKPDLIEPYLILGEVYLRMNAPLKLKNLITELNERFPENIDVFVLEVRRLILEGEFSKVLDFISGMGELSSPDLKFYLAMLKALQNDHVSAQKILRELEALAVKSKEFAIIKTGEASEENSFDPFDKLRVSNKLRTSEENEDNKNEKSSVSLEFTHKVSELAIVYEEFEEITEGKNPHLFALLAKALAQNAEGRLAREFADTAIKEDVSYIDAWILRGYANFLLKDTENALKDLRHAYELDPIRPRVHYFLALALHEAGKNEEAVLFFEKALEHKFEFSDEIRWKLVDIFNKQKKYGQVLDLYKELLDETVPRKKFTTAMHTIINLMKNPKAALKLTETLAEKKTDNVFILNMHSWALVANEKYIEAEEVLKKAEELEPENPRTFLNFGVLYEAQNKFEAAKKFYKKSYELGSNTEQNTVTDLAAQKYNELIELEKEIPFTSDKGRPAHAP